MGRGRRNSLVPGPSGQGSQPRPPPTCRRPTPLRNTRGSPENLGPITTPLTLFPAVTGGREGPTGASSRTDPPETPGDNKGHDRHPEDRSNLTPSFDPSRSGGVGDPTGSVRSHRRGPSPPAESQGQDTGDEVEANRTRRDESRPVRRVLPLSRKAEATGEGRRLRYTRVVEVTQVDTTVDSRT